MAVVFLLFAASLALFCVIDLAQEFKARNFRLAAAYIALSAFSLVLCICVLRNVHLISPSDVVKAVITKIFPPLG